MVKNDEALVQTLLKIPVSEKKMLQSVAKKRGVTLTSLLLDGARMLASLDDDFLNQVEAVAFSTKLSKPQVMTQLLLTYAAQDVATLEVFGNSATYNRAFQFEDGSLVTGSRLSEKVYAEVLQTAKELKKRLQDSAQGQKKRAYVSAQDAAAIAIQMPGEHQMMRAQA